MKAVKRPAKSRSHARDNTLRTPAAAGSSSSTAPPAVSTPTTVDLRGVPIHFPFEPYACQETYMEKVLDALHRSENALLESPTGTGKTLCLLCATLAWQRQQARLLPQHSQITSDTALLNSQAATTEAKPHRVPTIIYASRTHSQLSQVVRELRNTRYRPKHAVLGSREQMCVNPKVKKANATASDINYDCNKLNKDRKCRFRNNLDGFVAPRNESFQHYQVQSVMDMEDLVAMGTSEKVCPFYYTRSQVLDAELILVPYNYLFDKDAREGTLADVPWDNAVVIFDEAHNLESFASESASFDLTSADIAGCLGEINRVVNYVQAMPELGERVSLDNLARLKAMFMSLEEYMIQRIPEDRRVYSGEKMMEVFRDGMSINHANHEIFLNQVRKLDDITMEMSSGSSKGNPKLSAFSTCIKRVFGESSEARCLAKARAYRVHISPKEKNGRTISYWCFAPSLAMQELSDLNVRSIIVTSGTLSPLPSYSMELGLPFNNTLENPHIIANHQIHVRVIGRGVSGKLLNSSYNRRDDAEYLTELGNTLASLAKIVPGGMLVFFPSYGVMETCIERWGGPSRKYRPNENKGSKFFQARRKSAPSHQFSFPHAPTYGSATGSHSTPWKRLLSKKAVILEPKTTSELPDAISDFHKYLSMPKSTGCVLMGVCRGKISEGIDFAHDMCRAVIITGIPFAPYLDPKVKLKREYLDGLRASQSVKPTGDGGFGGDSAEPRNPLPVTLSGAEWYTQQAHRAVNQAVGRVIRNKSDYGAVLLLDSRFGEERNQQGLSKWVRPHIQNDEGFGQSFAGLTKFYREAQRAAAELCKKDQPAPIKEGVLLQYEKEGETNTMAAASRSENFLTRVAVVQKVASQEDGTNDESNDGLAQSYVPPDRVIARMDIDQTGQGRDNGTGAGAANQSRQSTTRPDTAINTLDDVYRKADAPLGRLKATPATSGDSSAWSNLPVRGKNPNRVSNNVEARKALRETTGNVRSRTESKSEKKSPALLFFEKLQACARKDELSRIKKEVIKMKNVGEKNDIRAYMQAAQAVLEILVRYDNFDQDNGNAGILDLFFLVLPKARQADVQRLCLKLNFRQSQFNEGCKRAMKEAEYKRLLGLLNPLLVSIHCGSQNASGNRSVSSVYLREVKQILEMLQNHGSINEKEQESNVTLTELFLRLVPAHLLGPTQAMLHTMQSSEKVEKIKAAERAKLGEGGVETYRFGKTTGLKPTSSGEKKVDKSEEQTPEMLEAQQTMQAALMQAEELNKAKRARIETSKDLPLQTKASLKNPYSSTRTPSAKIKREGHPSIATSTKESAERQSKKSRRDADSQPPVSVSQDKKLGSTRIAAPEEKPSDPIAQCLRDVESDSYVKRAFVGVNMKRKIRSNAPDDLKCGLCETKSETYLIADCGHTACSTCWMKWLAKSLTCPTCRVPTAKSKLARLVFEQKPGAGAPSLSQLCPPNNGQEDDDVSSDEELEIVGK